MTLDPSVEGGYTHFTKDSNRITVAQMHIGQAMQTMDIGMKVSIYCTAMESLFSTSHGEIIHQIAERIAYFLTNIPSERLSIYTAIKKIYASRSKYVHGATFKPNDLKNLKNQAIYADWILRWIFNRIIAKDSMYDVFDGKDLDKYMRDLLMGSFVLEKEYKELPEI